MPRKPEIPMCPKCKRNMIEKNEGIFGANQVWMCIKCRDEITVNPLEKLDFKQFVLDSLKKIQEKMATLDNLINEALYGSRDEDE